VATLSVGTAGTHVLHVWMREDGAVVDRIELSNSAAFTPTNFGDVESTQDQDTFIESSGLVAVEAEHFSATIARSGHSWTNTIGIPVSGNVWSEMKYTVYSFIEPNAFGQTPVHNLSADLFGNSDVVIRKRANGYSIQLKSGASFVISVYGLDGRLYDKIQGKAQGVIFLPNQKCKAGTRIIKIKSEGRESIHQIIH
jgi:hypothetical protein